MIRRDYILRMIEEFIRSLARIQTLTQNRQFELAESSVDEELQKLLKLDALGVIGLTESEILARLMEGQPTQTVADQCAWVATLLREAGDIHAANGREAEGRACHVKALSLLLATFHSQPTFELPAFVPKIDELMRTLADGPLPARTRAALMAHYEQIGEFAKAEDQLHVVIETESDNPALLRWAIEFYDRVLRQSDAALQAGNLPRTEVEAAREELCRRTGDKPG